MNNEEMLDEVGESLKREIRRAWYKPLGEGRTREGELIEDIVVEILNEILSLETDTCRIAVVRKEGELPKYQAPLSTPKNKNELVRYGYACCRQDMLSAGYVQEVRNA